MTMNDSAISDISRVLKVSINTVLKPIRQQANSITEPVVPARVTELQIDVVIYWQEGKSAVAVAGL
jgi:hypothetical protein